MKRLRWVLIVGLAVGLLIAAIKLTIFNPRLFAQENFHPVVVDHGNLRWIGIACRAYAVDRDGTYPDDWAALVPEYLTDLRVFVMQKNRLNVGAASNVMNWTDYTLIPGGGKNSPTNTLMAYLPPGQYPLFERDWAVVLFTDGRVDRVSPEVFRQLMSNRPNNVLEGTAR